MSSEFHWAFIGARTLGAKVAKQITRSGRHGIVSVYVRNPEKRAAFSKQYGALDAKTPEEAISAPGVDAVYVVTPHTTHYDCAKLALELGKPVLCEKPVSTDAEKVQDLIRLSREKGLYFAEAMWSWFSPVAQTIKKWYNAGEYGEITLFYPGGKTCDISVSILDRKGLERLRLEGTKAKTNLRFFHSMNQVKLQRKNGKNESFRGSGSMLNEFDLAAGEIREGLTERRYVPHEATLGVMELMDECRRQMGLVYPFEKV